MSEFVAMPFEEFKRSARNRFENRIGDLEIVGNIDEREGSKLKAALILALSDCKTHNDVLCSLRDFSAQHRLLSREGDAIYDDLFSYLVEAAKRGPMDFDTFWVGYCFTLEVDHAYPRLGHKLELEGYRLLGGIRKSYTLFGGTLKGGKDVERRLKVLAQDGLTGVIKLFDPQALLQFVDASPVLASFFQKLFLQDHLLYYRANKGEIPDKLQRALIARVGQAGYNDAYRQATSRLV